MRTLLTIVAGVALAAASAFANNIAVTGMATATASSSLTMNGTTYAASGALNWSSGEWVAPGGTSADSTTNGITYNPYLLITLNQPATVDSITVYGAGHAALFSAFDIFVGNTSPLTALSSNNVGISSQTMTQTSVLNLLSGMTLVGQTLNQQGSTTGWSDTFSVSTAAPIQYVLYLAISGNGTGCATTPCYPGDATFDNNGHPISGQEDAHSTGIVVDAVPEPVTLGFMLLGGLVFFANRFRK
jgi:hypothetical protein